MNDHSSLEYTDVQNQFCRVCGASDGIRFKIFKSQDYINHIKELLPVNVEESDKLSKFICHRCIFKLKEFHDLKIKSAETELILIKKLPLNLQGNATIKKSLVLNSSEANKNPEGTDTVVPNINTQLTALNITSLPTSSMQEANILPQNQPGNIQQQGNLLMPRQSGYSNLQNSNQLAVMNGSGGNSIVPQSPNFQNPGSGNAVFHGRSSYYTEQPPLPQTGNLQPVVPVGTINTPSRSVVMNIKKEPQLNGSNKNPKQSEQISNSSAAENISNGPNIINNNLQSPGTVISGQNNVYQQSPLNFNSMGTVVNSPSNMAQFPQIHSNALLAANYQTSIAAANFQHGNVAAQAGTNFISANNFQQGTTNIPQPSANYLQVPTNNNFHPGNTNLSQPISNILQSVGGFQQGNVNNPQSVGTNFQQSNINVSQTPINQSSVNSYMPRNDNLSQPAINLQQAGSNFIQGNINVPTSASNYQIGTSNIPVSTQNYIIGTSNVPSTAPNYLMGASNIPVSAPQNFAVGTSNVPTNAQNYLMGTPNVLPNAPHYQMGIQAMPSPMIFQANNSNLPSINPNLQQTQKVGAENLQINSELQTGICNNSIRIKEESSDSQDIIIEKTNFRSSGNYNHVSTPSSQLASNSENEAPEKSVTGATNLSVPPVPLVTISIDNESLKRSLPAIVPEQQQKKQKMIGPASRMSLEAKDKSPSSNIQEDANETVILEKPKSTTRSNVHILMTKIPGSCCIYTCELCERTFTKENRAKYHECKALSKNKSSDSNKVIEAEGIYMCEICNVSFPKQASLLEHKSIHSKSYEPESINLD